MLLYRIGWVRFTGKQRFQSRRRFLEAVFFYEARIAFQRMY
jgi:hypothetical protein